MCRPMRTRIGPAASDSVSRAAAATAPGAVGKAKKKASPCVSTSTPSSARACLADHAAVLGQRLGVRLRAELVQQPRRALDVGEEERDGAGRERLAHAWIMPLGCSDASSSKSLQQS